MVATREVELAHKRSAGFEALITLGHEVGICCREEDERRSAVVFGF